jgi:hypothetical protein
MAISLPQILSDTDIIYHSPKIKKPFVPILPIILCLFEILYNIFHAIDDYVK